MKLFKSLLLLLPLLQECRSLYTPGQTCSSQEPFHATWKQDDGQCCLCVEGTVNCVPHDPSDCNPVEEVSPDCQVMDICGCKWFLCKDKLGEAGFGEDSAVGTSNGDRSASLFPVAELLREERQIFSVIYNGKDEDGTD
ncbi:uncharacterized protein LOC135215513 [Macrobrachium nipponense]|uniref:uncharacterized protein LOC135215513 n=1 Tax=Macrobrachium nipponense TaxID=159736 RepID=UPI0030C7EB58